MKGAIGLVLAGPAAFKGTLSPYRLSLIGKAVVEHSLEALRGECEQVLVREVASWSELGFCLTNVLRRIRCDSPHDSLLVLHDALRPIVRRENIRQMISLLSRGAVVVGSIPWNERGVANGACVSVEPPFVMRASFLEQALAQIASPCLSLSELIIEAAELSGEVLSLVPRRYVAGRLYDDMTLDEAEALLAVKPPDGLVPGSAPRQLVKRVLLFGASGGIGSACASLLRMKGISYVAPSRGDIDLRYETRFSPLGETNAIIHAAGVYDRPSEEVMAVNFHSCERLLRAAEAVKWRGVIVFLSSTAAMYGRSGAAIYSASKAALNSLIQAEYERMAKIGVFVSAVAPAKVSTRLQEALNPGTPKALMIDPQVVARRVWELLVAGEGGRVLYIRKGEDVQL